MKIRVPLLLLLLALALPLAVTAARNKPAATPDPVVAPLDPTATPDPLATPKPVTPKAKMTPTTTPKMFPLRRLLQSMGLRKADGQTTATGFRGLEIGVQVEPPQVKVGEVKQLKVTVTLINRGKKMSQLDFPSSQRIEVLVKSKEGKTIEQWSQDQAFNADPTMVAINPNERLEYTVSVSTRDMEPGQTYAVEAFFPNFEQLRKSVSVSALNKGEAAATPAATPEKKKKSPLVQ